MLRVQQIRSSLPLEILLYINARISLLVFILLAGTYVFKVTYQHYPDHAEICEMLILLSFAPLEAIRISWARRGNLTETPTFISFSLLLGIPVMAICVYIGVFQNYILLIERVCVSVEAALVMLESLFSVAAVASFSRFVE
ncbi:hypothetical protein M3Y97_00667000 [Aphelenchoides bicaudatus]|nr:hypothetical protein M3Y97_00667000 [Aphelenchoides bicaudatus]